MDSHITAESHALVVSMTEPPPGLVRRLVLASESRSGRPPAPVDTPWQYVCGGGQGGDVGLVGHLFYLCLLLHPEPGNGARLGCQAVPTMPSNPAERYPYPHCTSDRA
jgi:hypothetical protein